MKLPAILLSAFCTLSCVGAAAQYHPAGNWLGTLNAGAVKLRVVFHITADGTALQATMDSPDQGVKGIPVPEVKLAGDSITLAVGPVVYRGRMTDDSTIDGVLIQGQRFPLLLHRSELKARIRPQTPQPPFPYASEDISFSNKEHTVTFGATITLPKDARKHPAVLLVTGSGQQNRDEEIMEHKPFAVMADYLTRRGFIVLRVDDRGIGKTTGDLSHATTADFAKDAGAALDYLKARPEVDVRKLGVLGHSEGGMIAALLAAERKDLAFIISMAGSGVPNLQVMAKQNDAIMEQRGLSETARKAYLELYTNIMNSVIRQDSKEAATGAIEKAVNNWKKETPADIVLQTTGIRDSATQSGFVSAFANQVNTPWLRYFIAFDPDPVIRNISCRVLAVNGAKDIQVAADINLAGWNTSLQKSHAKTYEIKVLPGLNHLFQQCSRCDTEEYGELEQTISPDALALVGAWLAKEMK